MSVLDLVGIKENIQTLLQNNNTTTSSVVDLSNSMVNRVSKILKTNPEAIPIQASFFPCVTVYMDKKISNNSTIAKNLRTGKRDADITMNVTGITWNSNMTTNDEDPADKDLEYLMENVEEILRSSDNFGGLISSHKTQDVEYHSATFDEQTHLRAGVMTLQMKAFY